MACKSRQVVVEKKTSIPWRLDPFVFVDYHLPIYECVPQVFPGILPVHEGQAVHLEDAVVSVGEVHLPGSVDEHHISAREKVCFISKCVAWRIAVA